MMELTKPMKKTLNEIKKKFGRVSTPWIQYKYHVSFKEAEMLLKKYERG